MDWLAFLFLSPYTTIPIYWATAFSMGYLTGKSNVKQAVASGQGFLSYILRPMAPFILWISFFTVGSVIYPNASYWPPLGTSLGDVLFAVKVGLFFLIYFEAWRYGRKRRDEPPKPSAVFSPDATFSWGVPARP